MLDAANEKASQVAVAEHHHPIPDAQKSADGLVKEDVACSDEGDPIEPVVWKYTHCVDSVHFSKRRCPREETVGCQWEHLIKKCPLNVSSSLIS